MEQPKRLETSSSVYQLHINIVKQLKYVKEDEHGSKDRTLL